MRGVPRCKRIVDLFPLFVHFSVLPRLPALSFRLVIDRTLIFEYLSCVLYLQVPAVGFAVFWVAKTQSSVMGENRLMHLVLLIEFAMPSAAVSTFTTTHAFSRAVDC